MTEDNQIEFCKSSKHYRAINYVFPGYLGSSYHSYNLCPYLRKAVAAFICLPFCFMWNMGKNDWMVRNSLIIQIVVVYSLMVTLASVMTGLLFPGFPMWAYWAIGFFGGVGLVLGVAGAGLGIMKMKDNIDDYMWNRPERERPSRRGLIKAYAHARHDKICPQIKFCEPPMKDKNGSDVQECDESGKLTVGGRKKGMYKKSNKSPLPFGFGTSSSTLPKGF